MDWRIRLSAALVMSCWATGMIDAQQPQPMPDSMTAWADPVEAAVAPIPRTAVEEAPPLVPPEPMVDQRVSDAALRHPALGIRLVGAVLGAHCRGGWRSGSFSRTACCAAPDVEQTSVQGHRPLADSGFAPTPWLVSALPAGPRAPESLPAVTLPEPTEPAPVVPGSTAISATSLPPMPVTLPVAPNLSIGAGTGVDPMLPLLLQHQPQLADRLYEQVLELEPNRDNRRTIERVREMVETTQVGVEQTDENWSAPGDGIQVNGRFHLDWVNWANDGNYRGRPAEDTEMGGLPNYVEFRRLRLGVAGEGYGVLFYQLEFEFSPEIDLRGTVENDVVDLGDFGIEVKDAYLGAHDIPWLGTVLLGHFFTPMGLELQTSSNFITFLERGLPRVFLPGRELGVAAYNQLPNQRMNWAYGIFFDEMNEAAHAIVDDNQGTRLVGRVTGTPFYDELSDGRYLMHLGLGYAYTIPRRRDSPVDPETGEPTIDEYRPIDIGARPEIHRGRSLVSTGDINTKQYHILNGEFAWIHGPLSVQSELIWTSLDELYGGTTDFYGSYFFASYFLTGENRRYDRRVGDFKRMTPLENFWLVHTPRGTSSGWGAWEVAARWSYLDLTDVRGQQLNDLTLGVNWYWNPNTRMMFNWIHPFTHNSRLSESTNAEGDILAMRLQVDF